MRSDFINLNVTLFKGDANGGNTHTLTLDESHDASTVESVLTSAMSKGWEIPSVIVDATYGKEELINRNSWATPETVSALLEYITDSPSQFDAAIAFCVENGLDEFSCDVMEDRFFSSHDSEEDFARDWWENNRPQEFVSNGYYSNSPYSSGELRSMELPEWLVIDWQATADSLADDFEYVHYAGSVHVFSK